MTTDMATNTTTVEETDEPTDHCVICDRDINESTHTLLLRRDCDGWYRGKASVCNPCAADIEEVTR